MKKKLWVVLITACLTIVSATSVYADWEKDEYGWRYRNPDGTYFIRGDLFEGDKHYVIRSGYLVTNKWVGSNMGVWSYVGEDGALLMDAITPDGYRVDPKGDWIDDHGRVIISEDALEDYRNPDHNVDRKGPHSELNGVVVSEKIQNNNGWELENAGWRYYNNGVMLRNQWIEGKYYVGEDGVMLRNTFTPEGFYVGDDGAWVDYGKQVPSNNSMVVQNPVDNSGNPYVSYNAYNSGADTTSIQRSAASEAAYQQRRREAEQAYQQRRQAAEQAYQARHNGTSNQSYQERRAAADQAYKERRAAADKAYKERHKRK